MELVISIAIGVWVTIAGILGYRHLRKEYDKK